MTIRPYQEADLDRLKEITVISFDGISIDQNIQRLHGIIAGKEWHWRKERHIDGDVQSNREGIFVAEEDGEVVGYITTRIDSDSKIGHIPNFAVLPEHQKKGIGMKLIETAFRYLIDSGMEYVRIETLDQNAIGMHFYPKLGFQEVARQVHFVMPLEGA